MLIGLKGEDHGSPCGCGFLRSLTCLDRKAAKQAFNGLTEGRNLTSAQNDFLDLIINHLTERGIIDPTRFYEALTPT